MFSKYETSKEALLKLEMISLVIHFPSPRKPSFTCASYHMQGKRHSFLPSHCGQCYHTVPFNTADVLTISFVTVTPCDPVKMSMKMSGIRYDPAHVQYRHRVLVLTVLPGSQITFNVGTTL